MNLIILWVLNSANLLGNAEGQESAREVAGAQEWMIAIKVLFKKEQKASQANESPKNIVLPLYLRSYPNQNIRFQKNIKK